MQRMMFAGLLLAGTVALQPATAQEIVKEYPGLETGTMWTFDAPPLEYWAERFGFRPSGEWLDHVRLSAVRQPGCSASFVSGAGLVMTNHHCARRCIDQASREGEDLLENGFYARTPEEERSCGSRMWLDQLLSIRDVTDSVTSAIPAGASPTAAADARAAAITDIEDRCEATGESLNCQVVSMYRGGQYKLYTFHRYTDIRLVFAPDGPAAFFGGDPDNFTYPRHDLDVTFYRAYENGKPVEASHHLAWDTDGTAEGDLVFGVGNPGTTGRLNTIAQMEFFRDVQYPAQLDGYARQLAVLYDLSRLSPARARAHRIRIFGLENSQKAYGGFLAGLQDDELMAWKRRWEDDFRARVDADPALQRAYGGAWEEIATIRQDLGALDARRRAYTFDVYESQLMEIAGILVKAPVELAKPDAQRDSVFRDRNRASLQRTLAGSIDTLLERRMIAAYFDRIASTMPADDPVRRVAIGDRSPGEAAASLVSQTVLTQPQQVDMLFRGGQAAVAGSSDPLIALARVIAPLEREVRAKVNALQDREAQQDVRIARALLAVFGASVAPDATFSLRITDGVIARYPYNGTYAAPYTTFYGLYDRWTAFGGKDPWRMHPRWIDAKDKIALGTPINAVSTNDTHGGNSGSPVINRDGELVGILFDGNIEGLPNRFIYTQKVARSVWVDGRGIIEALRSVYGADGLVGEILGTGK